MTTSSTVYGDANEHAVGRDREALQALRIAQGAVAAVDARAVHEVARADALSVGRSSHPVVDRAHDLRSHDLRSNDLRSNDLRSHDLRSGHGLDPFASAADRSAAHGRPAVPGDPLLQLLGTMRMGAVLVSREGRVVYLNDAGREALHAHVGLALRGDYVVALAPDSRRKLVAALNGACRAPFVDGAVLLSSTDGSGVTKPLRVLSMERVAGMPQRCDEGLALLCIGSARQRSPEAPMLAQLFGLTVAESALMAAVAGGERLHECAARRGVSLATVRAQLRNVFVKTGAATQADLTFIAWSIPGLWIN